MKYPLQVKIFNDDHPCYLYVDKKPCGSIFYIGIGVYTRVMYRPRNQIHKRICEKYTGCIREVIDGGTRSDMMLREKELVLKYGRLDSGTGRLANMTDGGEGASNYVVTDESRAKLSASLKKTYSNPELRNDISIRTRAMFQDPKIIKKHHDGIVKAWVDNDNKIKHRNATIKAMANPEVKKRQSEGIKKAFNTEAMKKRRSEISRKNMNNPITNAKLRKSLKIAMNRPETKEKMRLIALTYQSDPIVVMKKSEGTRVAHILKGLFIKASDYKERYSKISLKMIFDYVDTLDQAQADALNSKAADQTALRKAVADYRKNKSKSA